ncbi:MAG TPA: glycosyltransferase family 4 protein [Verrucomicrobiae bacterium]|nr:glycosyltransferase family 4 protein [Verrucomicrobiae bacterium]
MSLAVIETHPIQYHAPVYRALQQNLGVPVTAIYGSDFSVAGYRDGEFGAVFAWDTDLLTGYTSHFLSRSAAGGARCDTEATTRGLRDALRKAAPEAVLIVGYSPRFHRRAFLTAWRAGYPILFRAETNDSDQRSGGLKVWMRDQALRWLYARCQRLLYIGQRSKQHFERLGCPESKLVFSPYCVDATPFQTDESARDRLRGATRAALNIPTDKAVILFSGKLSKRKGPDLLLQSIKLLAAPMRDRVVVLFVGSGNLQPRLQTLALQPPAIGTRFVGFQNQKQLSQYYHAADLLVLPSLNSETWGLVVNDALHHGLPCIVSDAVGCAPDLIEPGVTGGMFPSGSASGLATAIAGFLPLMNLAEIRAKCRMKVGAYTIEKAAEGIAQAYSGAALHPRPMVQCA